MTRETKIGLLVGLAFIIVVGILLEDHFAGTVEPRPAPLQVVTKNVRDSYGDPAAGAPSGETPSASTAGPRSTIPLRAEQNNTVRDIRGGPADSHAAQPRNDTPGTADVRIGPGAGPGEATNIVGTNQNNP